MFVDVWGLISGDFSSNCRTNFALLTIKRQAHCLFSTQNFITTKSMQHMHNLKNTPNWGFPRGELTRAGQTLFLFVCCSYDTHKGKQKHRSNEKVKHREGWKERRRKKNGYTMVPLQDYTRGGKGRGG